jgi:hypothetical protein
MHVARRRRPACRTVHADGVGRREKTVTGIVAVVVAPFFVVMMEKYLCRYVVVALALTCRTRLPSQS